MAASDRTNNAVPVGIAKSNAGDAADVVLWADPSTHRLLVDVSGGGGTATTDDAAFTAGSGSGTPMMGFVTADSVNSGDVGVVGMLANRQLKVTLYDSAGVEASVGGGTQYDEDAAHSSGAKVTNAGVVRKDTAASLAGTDGDYSIPIVDASGKLWVNAEVTVALPAGTNAIGKLAANSGVDIGDVDVASVIPGTGATNLGKAIDTATGATDTGVLVLATRDDALSALTPVEGDNIQLRVDANGALWTHDDALDAALSGSELQVDVVASLPAGTNNIGDVDILSIAAGDNNIGNVDIVTMPNVTLAAGTNTNEVVGDVAHDAAAAGNPVAIAARATNSIEGLTQVAAADASYITSDLNGVIVTRPHTTLEEIITERVSDTGGTSTNFTNFAAGGAGVHNYVTTIAVYNSSSTDGYVDIRDGSAGSVLFTVPAPQTGGSVITFPVPLKGSANTALAYDVSGALTTVYISLVGFQAQG